MAEKNTRSVMGGNPSHFKGDDLPVEAVSWDDCQAFIRKVNVALECGAARRLLAQPRQGIPIRAPRRA